ncbi:MAG: sulfite exporter TauE/SafE family protein [Cryomorphaceae bacterium]|nr:MAG: sulfite exporter TauE/SafE family protein [Cryomorphaceae bacterium]
MALFFKLLLFIAAFLYAMVGHGGASSYLAIFALSDSVSPEQMRSTALVMNISVSLVSFLSYRANKHFEGKVLMVILSASVPAAFIGGMIRLPGSLYLTLLGGVLLLVGLRVAGLGKETGELSPMPMYGGILAGLMIGLLSGIVGIGGGVLLSPLILLMRWAPIKTTAGISAAFIFFNSVAGIIGIYSSGQLDIHPETGWWIALVIIGGFAGALLGSRWMAPQTIRYALAVVLLFAGVKLLLF